MTLAAVGPYSNSTLDSMLVGLGTTNKNFLVRRLTDTRFLLMRFNTGTNGTKFTFVVCDTDATGSSLTVSALNSAVGTSGDLQAVQGLSDGRFMVYNVNLRKMTLHDTNGTLLASSIISGSNTPTSTDGRSTQTWVADYMDMVETDPGTVILTMGGVDIGSGEALILGYQFTVGSSSLTQVNSTPNTILALNKLTDLGKTTAGGAPGLNTIGTYRFSSGVAIGACWGSSNLINHLYAFGSSGSGPVLIDSVSMGTNVRIRQPDVIPMSGGVALYGQTDIYGSGHLGSGTDDYDVVVTTTYDASTGFGTPAVTTFSGSLSGSYRKVNPMFQLEAWPSYSQVPNTLLRSVLISDSPEYGSVILHDTANLTEYDFGTWAGTERMTITMPAVAPWAIPTWNWSLDEALSTNLSVFVAQCFDNATGIKRFAVYFITRETAATIAPYLRMIQRDDGAGHKGHARLAAHQPSSSQQVSIRVAERQAYL